MNARQVAALALAAAALWYVTRPPADPDKPCPDCPPTPSLPFNPSNPFPTKPKLPRKPWGAEQSALVSVPCQVVSAKCACSDPCRCELDACPCRLQGKRCSGACLCVVETDLGPSGIQAKVGGNIAPDGTTQIQVDLPGELHLKNVGGSDGAGLCVFTSIAHSARWQNIPVLEDFRDWMRSHPGGGYPSKVDRMIDQVCKERGLPKPAYVQVEGKDLEVLKLACKTGRMPAVTYSYSPTGRYGGSRIAHMVSLPHADDTWFCVLDNNFPGTGGNTNTYEWMSPQEFTRAYTGGGGQGWSVILLQPGPPPPPRNR